jgi:hypothetical protein
MDGTAQSSAQQDPQYGDLLEDSDKAIHVSPQALLDETVPRSTTQNRELPGVTIQTQIGELLEATHEAIHGPEGELPDMMDKHQALQIQFLQDEPVPTTQISMDRTSQSSETQDLQSGELPEGMDTIQAGNLPEVTVQVNEAIHNPQQQLPDHEQLHDHDQSDEHSHHELLGEAIHETQLPQPPPYVIVQMDEAIYYLVTARSSVTRSIRATRYGPFCDSATYWKRGRKLYEYESITV